ncbi:MAG: hypothetical protein H0W71_05810 [Sphingomonas sp.]|nr:hypothetical protein [Sphingomonas sp.]
MTRILALALVNAAALAAGSAADARGGGWKTINETIVDSGTSDTIYLTNTRNFSQLKLCVRFGPLKLRDVEVRFRSGKTKYLAGERIDDGDCGARIELSGSRRDASGIKLTIRRSMPAPVVPSSASRPARYSEAAARKSRTAALYAAYTVEPVRRAGARA